MMIMMPSAIVTTQTTTVRSPIPHERVQIRDHGLGESPGLGAVAGGNFQSERKMLSNFASQKIASDQSEQRWVMCVRFR
jgi:hypothetical protein